MTDSCKDYVNGKGGVCMAASGIHMGDEQVAEPVKPTTRRDRVLMQIQYLVNAVPELPKNPADFKSVRDYLVVCSTIALGASRIFEKVDLGDDLDGSLHNLILFVTSVLEAFTSSGTVSRPETLPQVREQLCQFFCTFHETVQRFK